MANYRKSFNFRNGVQVDNDNFVVNQLGLVGIGTTIPTEFLDVRGNVTISGLTTTDNFHAGMSTISTLNVSDSVTVSQDIDVAGVVTATTFHGSAAGLTGIYAIAVDGWYTADSAGIHTTGSVGIGTTAIVNVLTVSGGTDIDGDLNVSGVATATSFYGSGANLTSLNASNISSGTLDNARLSGIITASQHFDGRLVGVADTADSVTTTSLITVAGVNVTGVVTTTNIEVTKSGISSVHIKSTDGESSISVGRSDGFSNSIGKVRFGNTNLSYLLSTDQSLDIINYDDGNINSYLQYGSTGVGTGNFNWIYGQNPNTSLMTLTYDGKLGINQSDPSNTLEVDGGSYVTGNSYVGGASTVAGNLTVDGSITIPNIVVPILGVARNAAPTAHEFEVGENGSSVGIGSTGNIDIDGYLTGLSGTFSEKVTANNIETTNDIVVGGNLVASTFGDGTGIVNVDSIQSTTIGVTTITVADKITSNISIASTFGDGTGIVTASTVYANIFGGGTGTVNVQKVQAPNITGVTTITSTIGNITRVNATHLDVTGVSTSVDLNVSNQLTIDGTLCGVNTTTTETTSQTAIDASFQVGDYRTIEYTIQATEGSNYHSTKILAIHDGSNAYHTEYGSIFNSSELATYDVDVNAGNIRVLATPASANLTRYVLKFEAMRV